MPRRPVEQGRFYPGSPAELRSAIESYTPRVEKRSRALGALVPHAGYVFSGGVAGRVFAEIEVPDVVLLLNPSHHFGRPALALWTDGPWQTPLGEVAIHEELTRRLAALPGVTSDDRPHLPEHSGEVVVPFLRYHNPGARMAVVCVTQSADLAALKRFGAQAAEELAACGAADALVVASSDMSHEQGAAALRVVNEHDPLAIEQMERLDPDGLYQVVERVGITMCGVLPAVAMMAGAAARGATCGRLVARATSADSPYGGGDYIVGYAGMLFA